MYTFMTNSKLEILKNIHMKHIFLDGIDLFTKVLRHINSRIEKVLRGFMNANDSQTSCTMHLYSP